MSGLHSTTQTPWGCSSDRNSGSSSSALFTASSPLTPVDDCSYRHSSFPEKILPNATARVSVLDMVPREWWRKWGGHQGFRISPQILMPPSAYKPLY